MKAVKPRKRWKTRFFVIGAVVLCALVVSIIAAVTVSIRVESGEWRVPERDDFVRIARRFDHKPSKVIYMERRGVELSPGDDHAAQGVSSVVATAANKTVRTRGFSGGDAKWKSIMSCVKKMFGPFDVTVTDQRPTDD